MANESKAGEKGGKGKKGKGKNQQPDAEVSLKRKNQSAQSLFKFTTTRINVANEFQHLQIALYSC